jgi:hypothetical protein
VIELLLLADESATLKLLPLLLSLLPMVLVL